MKATIRTSIGGYGFSHDWNLIVTNGEQTRNFYLGQDVKFCSRVLGMSPAYVVEQIGSSDMSDPDTLEKLGNFILDTLELDESIFDLQSWELCCQ
jgi:hypothetical protein